ncbi:MAG: 16S rRNA (adenine(1518)-N(6)/adenine(1519)-N(6))-dimethyltransferase RsmA [Candidatus Omnitrophica bacterium]|nr:16S rRNA (adenine(1518)-N(6)/adenine(1519)-N(6))-dimethyltransferase RsmA [Candidatus Omnitrophota bacterium]
MLSKKGIRALEKKYGFRPQKKMGQNFLIDGNIKEKIIAAAGVTNEDTVLEIGSGLGQLTFDFSEMAKTVIAIEFDKKLFSVLSDLSRDRANVVLVQEDFLKFKIKEILPKKRKIKVVSNLPYYISTPVILKLFAHSECIDSAVLTLQKEVADRLVAGPRSKDYGSLTLFAQFHSEIKRLFSISRNSFYPVPGVDSTVVAMNMRRSEPVSIPDKNDLFELIRSGFSKRRKTLVNAVLSQGFKELSRDKLEGVLDAAGIPRDVRAEALELSDFARIINSIG